MQVAGKITAQYDESGCRNRRIDSPATMTTQVTIPIVRTPIARAIGIVRGAAKNETISDDGKKASPAISAS